MKLNRAERWMIVVTLVFLVGTGLWQAHVRARTPVFQVTASAQAETPPSPARTETVRGPAPAPEDGGKVNINTADERELQTLSGIGEVLARRIVEYRETYGPFRSPEELTNVSGVGQKTLEANLDRLTVGNEEGNK